MAVPGRRFCWAIGLLVLAGCGAPTGEGTGSPSSPAASKGAPDPSAGGSARKVAFVGFDTSAPVLNAMKAGKVQGVVVQNPYLMGDLAVRTLVAHLEKKPVETVIDTGGALVTPENMTDPKMVELLNPPKEENVSGASLSSGKTKKWRVFVIPKGTTHEFWKTIHAGAKKAADELGTVDLVWQGPHKEDDRLQQIQLVQNAIAARVDGIVLAPLDSRALVKPVEEAVARGIPVVVMDSSLESKATVSYVATDNYKGGVLGARRIGEVLKGEGKVVLLRYMVGSASTEQREAGFTETLAKEFPRITLLSSTEYAGPTAESAQQKSQSLVTRYRGQIDGVFAPNETSCEGMLRALEAAGMLPVGP